MRSRYVPAQTPCRSLAWHSRTLSTLLLRCATGQTVLKSGGIVREFVPPPPSPIPTAPLPDSDKLGALVNADQITVGMITRFLSDEDQTLRMNAVQVYIRRLYRSYNLQRINSFEKRTTTGHCASRRPPACSIASLVCVVACVCECADRARLC